MNQNPTGATRATITRFVTTKLDGAEGKWLDNKLTESEEKVVALIAKGKTNLQIAFMFETTEQVIKNKVSKIYKKAKVSSRAELIIRRLSTVDQMRATLLHEEADLQKKLDVVRNKLLLIEEIK